MAGFIDYEKLEDGIKSIENIFSAYGWNADEKEFAIKQVLIRMNKQKEKQRMSDLVSQNMSGGLLKNMTKKLMEGDKE